MVMNFDWSPLDGTGPETKTGTALDWTRIVLERKEKSTTLVTFGL